MRVTSPNANAKTWLLIACAVKWACMVHPVCEQRAPLASNSTTRIRAAATSVNSATRPAPGVAARN